MNHTPFFDPKKGVPYQRLSPPSGSDGELDPGVSPWLNRVNLQNEAGAAGDQPARGTARPHAAREHGSAAGALSQPQPQLC
eukprot:COSAG02_NODE_44124_length_361_cov_6.312268_1_plen_80_part_10